MNNTTHTPPDEIEERLANDPELVELLARLKTAEIERDQWKAKAEAYEKLREAAIGVVNAGRSDMERSVSDLAYVLASAALEFASHPPQGEEVES